MKNKDSMDEIFDNLIKEIYTENKYCNDSIENITAKMILQEEHNLRPPYDRSKGQIQQIVDLIDNIKEITGKEIQFDNTWSNHYKLMFNDEIYEFNIYKDVINALKLIISLK